MYIAGSVVELHPLLIDLSLIRFLQYWFHGLGVLVLELSISFLKFVPQKVDPSYLLLLVLHVSDSTTGDSSPDLVEEFSKLVTLLFQAVWAFSRVVIL